MSEDRPGLTPEELEAEDASQLPNREAMSLISGGSTVLPIYTDPTSPVGLPELSAPGAPDPSAGGTAPSPTPDVTPEAAPETSGTEQGTTDLSSDDRSDVITQSDSSSAGAG